ncbi:DNA polymerase III subunit alpha [Dermatobacter hominis]|uniref:DNA polymerase III subunit alpha n=1 Tax=Dermatobacter hominis TaxID=2884263 RepID=UPI001D128DC1|nr:DNA polymerase III subunit alpha [Dermatobacter hominis]UDY35992.1 DNA polymerase III subunit alpha [Dermatobacter hominis]
MPDSFVHLHQHTEYSMLDGAARIGDVVASAVADGQPAMGITDHGNMYGILDFYKECRKQGVTPIIGTEAYMAHDSRFERPPRRGRVDDSGGEVDGGKKLYYHLTLLAESDVGYKNLIQLASRAYMEGYYYKPRVDWDTLAEHHEGVIATTGCLGGHVLQSLMNEGFDAALEKAARLQDIFGRDNLFVEIQDHGIPEQHRTNPQLLEIAKKIQAPLLATNDSHYVHRGDAVAHDALLCVQTASLMSDPDRFKFHGDEHYLKTAQEMRHLFSEVPESCDNTLWIAERCNVEIDFGNPQLPNFPLPEGFTDDAEYLEHLTFEGARQRWGEQLPDNVVERLAYELKVIGDMGFSSYFLIVWDLIKHARDTGIRVGPGRGSAAGCAVAYTLWITDLDPIKYDLLFERFLNPSRISMPDIDMDFDSRYRDEMIRYAAERYGRDHVAQIVTFSTIKARAAVRDAARVLGKPYIVGDKVAKAMPPLIMGRDTPLYACLEEHPKFVDGYKMAGELRDMYHTDPEIKEVVDVAKGLEGLRRGDGIHAAAVVITKEPLTEYLPIQRKPEAGVDIEDAPVVTQYEMHGVEELGLLKMDFLGLRNLDVISDTLELIERTRGITVDIDNVDLADGPTYELLRRADTIGVFQLEGGPMRALIRSLAPTEFEDVAALVALYRPGPMAANMHTDYADRKNGRQEIAYLHPDAEEILGDTYGLCLTGDTTVIEARSGRPTRLDEIDPSEGFWVQGVDGDLRLDVRQVTHWVDNGVRDTVTLTLANGMTLTGTPDHPVLTARGWVGLGELTEDDRVATSANLYVSDTWEAGGVQVPRALANSYVSDPVGVGGVQVPPAGSGGATTLERDRGIEWTGVTSVVPSGRQRVFDITVDEIHNFVANGIVAHNCIYQEGIMRIAQRFAGYSLADADNLRKACGKKVRELIAKERTKFVEGCEATGYGADLGTAWFDIIEPFADYAFNKSHSYGYGFVAYQTAYLKANYPAEYLSALLTSVKSSLEKAAIYLAECRAIGIEVTVPDVNRSLSDFAPVVPEPNGDGATADTGSSQILFGLSAVRNVGEGLVELILAERDENGPFEDFYDFCQRVNTQVLNKRTIESLIKAGGFDSMGHPRQGLLTVFEQIVDATIARRKEHDMGVMSLFGEIEDGPAFDERIKIPDVEFDKKQRLAFEKEMLGLYVSDHPLLGAEQALKRKVDCNVLELNDLEDGTQRTIGGVITGLQRKWTKKGDLMAVFVLEDLQGSVEVMVFPKTMAQIGHLLVEDAVVVTTGRVDKRDETAKFIPRELELFEPQLDEHPPLRLHLPPSRLDDDTIVRLQELIGDFPGESEVHILLGERQVLRLSDEHLVNTQSGIIGELRALLGHESVVL